MARTRHTAIPLPPCQPPQVQLWICRILVRIWGLTNMRDKDDLNLNHGVRMALGLNRFIEKTANGSVAAARSHVIRQLTSLEKNPECSSPHTVLRRNINLLRAAVGLSELEAALLEFSVSIHTIPALGDAGDLLGKISCSRLTHIIATVLGTSQPAVAEALGPRSQLTRSGLLTIDARHGTTLQSQLDLLGRKFANTLATAEADVLSLLRGILTKPGAAKLRLSDYDHLQAHIRLLKPYLRAAVAGNRCGTNILLYGPPGTGKTELVKAVARELELELFEITYEDEDGDAVSAERRLRAFRIGQSFFRGRKTVLLFDEIEDVFNDGSMLAGPSTAQKRKAWINRQLESNRVPTFWVSNRIQIMDRAFLRRFDLVIEVPIPPLAQRRRIAERACADLIPATMASQLARSDVISPAVLTRATDVVRYLRDELGDADCASTVEQIIDATLEAQGHHPLRRQEAHRLPQVYDPAFIAADCDLEAVAQGLLQSRSGRLCLYGPPGTGKTAFGHWLANTLGVPLHVKRVSDLAAPYVGMTERNIAKAFDQATRDGAVLLIDEVDSFLRDRRTAQRSWEVTEVNEMLTQMEAFPGVFIASTNLMDHLDQGAMRRFDLKVKFDYLRSEQSRELLVRYCQFLQLTATEEDKFRIGEIRCLTPGDYAAVYRRSHFHVIASAQMFVTALEVECAAKDQPARQIGFLH